MSPQDFERGITAFRSGNLGLALEMFTKLASQGHSRAQFQLGLMYVAGIGTEKDRTRALEYLEASAAGGDPAGLIQLASEVEDPKRSHELYCCAHEILSSSAAAGDPESNAMLGHLYRWGYGVARDVNVAVDYYTKAAEAGYGVAMNNLVAIYGTPIEGKYDRQLAEHWQQRAIDAGFKIFDFP